MKSCLVSAPLPRFLNPPVASLLWVGLLLHIVGGFDFCQPFAILFDYNYPIDAVVFISNFCYA